ncbi:nicotinate phosphoribosyltransferase [Bacillus thuringiensis]|uniref:nicotinate phosphoribosyltransferase n=1 Tax=Bacillus toyonensis TaxID=155322 RepID=UPI001298DAD0|nr:nicotinate phosphoribosyltransferase [Bacillus thuringiensis]
MTDFIHSTETDYILPPTVLCDFYKTSHRPQYPKGTEVIYSTLTPRSNKFMPMIDKVVTFEIQSFVKEYLIGYFNKYFFARKKEDVVAEYARVIKFCLGEENPDTTHIAELHDLGYLPVRIKALKEGTLVPMRVPMMTIENTMPKFFWITNYLETLISAELWQGITSASIALQYRKILNKYAMRTVGNTDGVEFQGHDFSMRGMSSLQSAQKSGAGHLLSFVGTDTIPAILYLEKHYNANIEKELVGTSIPATEHSVMCANGQDEYEVFKRMITEVYPNGLVSIVSDTWDFWNIVGEIIPRLKEVIENRDGKVVIRPDSGIPEDILCGAHIPDLTGLKYVNNLEDAKEYFYDGLMEELREDTPHGEHGDSETSGQFKFEGKYYELEIEVEYDRHDKRFYYICDDKVKRFEEFTPSVADLGLIEALWNVFGGTITEKGYKVLAPCIGAIYGDAITLERCETICQRLAEKGFASTNVVFGIGSFTYQHNTRDTFGFAMKATYAVINGEEKLIYKDPKTDSGMKKSQKGRVVVLEEDGELKYIDGLNKEEQVSYFGKDQLEQVFFNGQLHRDESLQEIRERIEHKI